MGNPDSMHECRTIREGLRPMPCPGILDRDQCAPGRAAKDCADFTPETGTMSDMSDKQTMRNLAITIGSLIALACALGIVAVSVATVVHP